MAKQDAEAIENKLINIISTYTLAANTMQDSMNNFIHIDYLFHYYVQYSNDADR